MPLGLYISVPFCRTKCSYCNFASDVFSKSAFHNYVERVVEEIATSRTTADEVGGEFDDRVDSIYLGGGTPSILDHSQLLRIFEAARAQFCVSPEAEITVECAPGTLTDSLIDTLLRAGVNRVSLGVQSFVDQEAQSVGRLHKRSTVLDEIDRLRRNGLENINVDLIAGLPHQTSGSWVVSLEEVIALGVPHVSVYMLEVDEDSRLGRELIAGGTRYHAHFVPDEASTADFYAQACETLDARGIKQYEISNFACSTSSSFSAMSPSAPMSGFEEGWQSRHNLKYWTRQPYLGFGVDAHSMLPAARAGLQAIRFSTPDSLDAYMNRASCTITPVSKRAAIEETFFLGLRLNRGLELDLLRTQFGSDMDPYDVTIQDCARDGLLEKREENIRLTPRGRLLSNEVFSGFLLEETDHKTADASRPGMFDAIRK
ncbi:MAG TPA: coproporphyrinogen-III oxidase family protein [Terriglobales bacterium]|nr:coproporphyrinogen-III oxidase family protein [Terriglobales bacterium]